MLSTFKKLWSIKFTQSESQCDELQESFESDGQEHVLSLENSNNQNEELNKAVKLRGTVTSLSSNHGFIDKTIFFDMEEVEPVATKLTVGCEVDYLLYRNPRTEHLKVLKIELIVDEYQEIQENKENETENPKDYFIAKSDIPGVVVGVIPKAIRVETNYDTVDLSLNDVICDFKPKQGDRVYLCAEVYIEEFYIHNPVEILEVNRVVPFRILIGKIYTVIAVNGDWATLTGNCYVTFDILPNDCKLTVGDIIYGDAIKCKHEYFSWRCIDFTTIKDDQGVKKITRSPRKNEGPIITVTKDQICIFRGLDQEQTVSMSVVNNGDCKIKVNSLIFPNQNGRNKMVNLINSNVQNGFEVPSNSTYVLKFRVISKSFGESRECLVINFDEFRIKRSIIIIVYEEKGAALKIREKNAKNPTAKCKTVNAVQYNRFRHYANEVWSKERQVTPGVGLIKKRRFVANNIPPFDVPILLRNAYLSDDSLTDIQNRIECMYPCLKEELSYRNYIQRFQTLLFLEEMECFCNFRSYDRECGQFKHEGKYLALTVNHLLDKRPSVGIGDSVNAIHPFAKDPPIFQGFVHKVFADKLLLKFDDNFHNMYRNESYRLEFFFSRFTYRKYHFAVKQVVHKLGEEFLFPSSETKRKSPLLNVTLDKKLNMHLNCTQLKWFNPCLNEYQRRAVYNILRGGALNTPYVVFGPPGTGKTVTVVEAILQLLARVKNANIIVATPSNSSANLIATRLLDSEKVCPEDLVRLVSHSLIDQDLIPKDLMPYCATVDVGLDGTCKNEMKTTESGLKIGCQLSYLRQHRITIGTCTTLGNYMLLNFPPTHFSHVIIEEAGQCLEPESMIPLSLVTRNSGQVVLVGDPHQLPPSVINCYAENLGLTVTFLERILDCPPYQKDEQRFPDTCGYNPLLLTKLLYSYRAIPSILKVYNDFFYECDLMPILSGNGVRISDLWAKIFPNSTKQPKASHGTFFFGVRGENAQYNDSPSWYNDHEARFICSTTLKLYKENISPEDIGIITPYTRQVKYLRDTFAIVDFAAPKIGTVEEFQGQERDIILISMVRSPSAHIATDLKNSLSFVSSRKRMNVAFSRARYLMIVFGNPHFLCHDPYWRKFIKYCVVNDAYEGCDLPDNFNTLDDIEN